MIARIDCGQGPPLVLVPGIQGRCEWMRPTAIALSRSFRVLSFTLAGERTSGCALEPRLGFDSFVEQIDRLLEEAGVTSAVLCGVSYGGLVALRYAALRPARVRQLVLASALAPGYEPDSRVRRYSRAPRLFAPVFCVSAWRHSRRELQAALPTWRRRAGFRARQVWMVASAPVSPVLMRDRIRMLEGIDFAASARRVAAPALVVTGEPALDQVVPVAHTLGYGRLLPRAEIVQLPRTGHLGVVTRPDVFAAVVSDFVERTERGTVDRGERQAAG
jgi:pimeloyl-ACP methyl ester carboxylesterase